MGFRRKPLGRLANVINLRERDIWGGGEDLTTECQRAQRKKNASKSHLCGPLWFKKATAPSPDLSLKLMTLGRLAGHP